MSLDLLSDVLTVIIVFMEIVCCVILFDTLLINKSLIKYQSLNCFLKVISLLIFSCLITRNIRNYVLQSLFIIALYFIILEFFYDGKFLIKLCISLITYMLLLAVDTFSAILIFYFLSLPLNMLKNNPLHFILATIFSKTLFYFIIVIIKKILPSKHFPELKYVSTYHWFVYILQSTISLWSLLALIETSYQLEEVPLLAVLASFGLLFLNFIVLFLLESSSRRGKIEYENALYRQQIETETDNIKILIKSFETQRQYFHDHKQYLSTIYQLIYDKKYEQAQNCIKSIQDDIYVSLYRIKTNHAVIDAILNQKYLQAESQNITLDIRAGDLSTIKIPNHLLITIISNAIDNALEACKQVPCNPLVSVKIIIEEGFLIFSVINPILREVKIHNNLIETTKDDKSIHGMGLKNISIALSKCDGDYEIICANQMFQFTALIRL